MEHETVGDTICKWSPWNDPKMLVRGLEELKTGGQAEAIQTAALLRSATILKNVQETSGYLLSIRLQWNKHIYFRWYEKRITIIMIVIKFDHTNKSYTYNLEYVLENEIDKLLWDFAIQTDHLTSAWQPDLIIINSKKRELGELWTLLSRLTSE